MKKEEYNWTVDQYSDGVFRFILKTINSVEKAKDIVQDSFEKLWKNHENIDFTKAKSYLFTTAYHTAIDFLRREKKKVDIRKIDISGYSYEHNYSDLQDILHKAILQLPTDQRSVLLLRDYEGYSYKEISDITELTEAQVKVYIYRARIFLKNYIVSIETLV
jgi:RNA polymerase sigma-70 factor (ECF subfamily)